MNKAENIRIGTFVFIVVFTKCLDAFISRNFVANFAALLIFFTNLVIHVASHM